MADISRLWQKLISVALLGTERQPFVLPAADTADPLGALLASLDPADPERALLDAIAALTLYRRAGELPPVDSGPLPTPCDSDDLPRVNPEAGRILMRLLKELGYRECIGEWLQLAAQAGQRAPEEALVGLLVLAKADKSMQPLVYAVLGKRGHWLMRQQKAWALSHQPPQMKSEDPSVYLEQRALEALKRNSTMLCAGHTALNILQTCAHLWSTELTRAVLNNLRPRLAAGAPVPDDHLARALPFFVRHMALVDGIDDEIEQMLTLPVRYAERVNDYWQRAVHISLDALRFRREMHEAFHP